MSWNLRHKIEQVPVFWNTLAFRLTAWYVLGGLALVVFASASLYFLLVTQLEKSTDEFLADKVNVLRTMLRERPEDWDGLSQAIELESGSRRYEQFYMRLLDERNVPLLTTPGIEDQLDVAQLTAQTQGHEERSERVKGRGRRLFVVTSAAAVVGNSGQTDT